MTDRTCPNCGAALPPLLAHARMAACGYCGTSVVLDDAGLRSAGSAGIMHDAPELVTLGGAVDLPQGRFEATGHVRYDYGRGHWDEYHGLVDGMPAWLSVDEGDVALQHPVDAGRSPPPRGGRALFRLGARAGHAGREYRCAEVDDAVAVAFRGQLPEQVTIGDRHLYANFVGPDGAILSGELWPGGEAWFEGRWIDPFDIRPTT